MLDLATALSRATSGILIVFYPDFATRAVLIADIRSLLPAGTKPKQTASVAKALGDRDHVILLLPEDEAAAVRELDGNRDRFLEPPRSAPVILFLLRNGTGYQELAEAPGLASWTRNLQVDPSAKSAIDVAAERQAFFAATGQTPEEWLAEQRAEDAETDTATLARGYLAALLERRP